MQDCNTAANPNVWENDFYCSYGCDSSTNPDECKAAPGIPYCINKYCDNCDTDNTADDQRVWCWDTFEKYRLLNGLDPDWTTCLLNQCSDQQCHPTIDYCIGNNVSPCPISAYPTRTEKWLDNCGGIDCRIPVSGSCGSSNPSPTPTPVPETPTCTITGISANPSTYLPGNANTYAVTLTTTNYFPANTVDEVSFRVYNAANELVVGPTIDTTANPYSFSFTPQTSGTFKIIATGSIYRTGFVPCTRELTINVPRHTTTLNVEGYSTPFGACIPTLITPPLTATLSRTPYPVSWLPSSSFSNIETGNDLTYTLTANNPTNYTYDASICTSPPLNEGTFVGTSLGTAITRVFSMPYTNPSNTYTFRFYFTPHAYPWFQVDKGDVGSKTGSIIQEVPYNQTMLIPLTGDSSGVAVARHQVTITGDSYFAPDYRLWQAEDTGLVKPENWFGYFKRTYEIVQQTNSSFSGAFGGGTYYLEDEDLGAPDNIIENRITESYNEFLYYHNSNLTINEAINVPFGEKHTIFIDGDLTINTPTITVPPGSFLGFIVSGNITFGPNTSDIDGFYVANLDMTFNDAAGSTGIDRQFKGNGLFIASGAVSLQRDLDPDQTNSSFPNNTNPAELFTYRPDFAANAPRGLKRIPVRWREIEPQSIDGL